MKSMYRHAPRIDRSESAAPARKRPQNKKAGTKRAASKKPAKKAPQKQAKKSAKKDDAAVGFSLSPGYWRAIKVGCLVVLALGAVLGGVSWGSSWLSESNRLAVQHVDVEGAVSADVSGLLAYAGVRKGQSILSVELDEAARNVRRHPWVADATVVRSFPNRVIVEVREHRPAALVALEGLYLVNPEGEVFKRWSTDDPRGLPLVTGLERDSVTKSPVETAALLRTAIGLADELNGWLDTVGELEEVHYDPALGWSAVTRPAVSDGEPVTLALGLDPHARVALAARSLIELGRRSLSPAVVWADGSKHSTRVQARLRVQETTGNQESDSEVSQ